MVDYALAGEGAGDLIDRDSYKARQWPENGAVDEVYKHCGCTMITKCSIHDDYSTYKFLLSDPLSTQSEIWSYKQEQEQPTNRSETIGNYILFHELLDRYPYYFLRGSSKTGDTFYRQKGARFNYVPPYRVCANELYHKQKQWVQKESTNETRSRPLSAPPTPTLRDESKKTGKNARNFLPLLPPRKNPTATASATRSYHRDSRSFLNDMSTTHSSPPAVDNRFDFELPNIYTRLVEPIFDWNRFRRSQLQFKLAESLHGSHVYDRCNCSMVTSLNDNSLCLAHAANKFSQTKIDGSILPTLSCPCMFCRKRFEEKDRPQGLPSTKDLKQLFPTRGSLRSNKSPTTMTYLSRPYSAPVFQATFPLDLTFATRYVPTYKRTSRPNGVKEEIFDIQPIIISKSSIPSKLGMRLDSEPNHDHTQVLNLPRERDAFFRSFDDYFNMTPDAGPTMIL